MPADLIVYALVAAGLVFWLRSILGTRHGDERNRPNPYLSTPENAPDAAAQQSPYLAGVPSQTTAADKITQLAQNPTRVVSVDNKNAENGLLDIARADKDFDIDEFLNAAQEAFAVIVESFGDGDRELLRELLAPQVFNAFDGAIREREKNGETMKTEIHAIRRADVIEAGLDKGRNAFISVRFRADETSVVYDRDDKVISGHPDKVSEMRDIWVFGRDIRSRSPAWLVQETRSDVDGGDNDTVPNSD